MRKQPQAGRCYIENFWLESFRARPGANPKIRGLSKGPRTGDQLDWVCACSSIVVNSRATIYKAQDGCTRAVSLGKYSCSTKELLMKSRCIVNKYCFIGVMESSTLRVQFFLHYYN